MVHAMICLALTRWLEVNEAADLVDQTKYVTFSVVIRYY